MQASLVVFEQAIKKEGERPYLIKIALLILLYVISAQLGLSLAFSIEQATTIWPPTGISIAALLFLGYHYAPGVFVGALLSNVFNGTTALASTGIAFGNTLEALVAVILIKRFVFDSQILEKISSFMWFLLTAVFIAPAVSATIGVSSLVLAGEIDNNQFNKAWLIWWVGNMLSALIIVPFVVAWRDIRYRKFIAENLFETIFILVIVATAGFIVFSQPTRAAQASSLLIYLLFPLITWAAVRLTQIGAVTAGTIITIAAAWGTLAHSGPYTLGATIEENLIYLHLFILVITVTGNVLGIAVSGRLRSEQALRAKAAELENAKKEIKHNVEWRKELQDQVVQASDRINDILGGIFEDKPKK